MLLCVYTGGAEKALGAALSRIANAATATITAATKTY